MLVTDATQPCLLVDVDGVISLFGFDPASPPPGRGTLIDGVPHLVSHEAGRLLTRLQSTFECVWCTGWEERAEEHLPHLLGWPPERAPWPHLSFDRAAGPGTSTAGHWKLDAIDAYTGAHRPVAWIDDVLDAACERWAAARPGPTLLVATDPATGLTADHAHRLERWAATLP